MPSALQSLADWLPSLLASDDEADLAALARAFSQIGAWLDALAQMPPALRTPLLPSRPPTLDAAPSEPALVGTPPPPSDVASPVNAEEAPGSSAALPGYRFQRALRGGWLSSGVRVPESAVREHDLQTGDRVTATPATRDPLPGRYFVTLLARDPDPSARERTVIPMALVESDSDGGTLIIRKALGNGEHFDPPIVIQDADIHRLGLRAGDVVDLAYWTDDPTSITVAWRYRDLAAPPPEQVASLTVSRTRPASNHLTTVDVVAESSLSPIETAPPSPLTAQRVFVVGCPPKHREYQEAVEAAGGRFEGFTGDETPDRLEAAVKRSDVVIILKGMLSHQAVNDAKRFAKKHSVVYRICGSFGIQTVVDRAAKALAKKLVPPK